MMVETVQNGINNALFIAVTFFALILVPMFLFGAQFETKYFPPAEKITVEKLNEGTETGSYLVGFVQLRECKIIEDALIWKIVNVDGEKRIAVQGNKPIKNGNYEKFTVTSVDNLRHGAINSQTLTIKFQCHSFWSTPMIINITE